MPCVNVNVNVINMFRGVMRFGNSPACRGVMGSLPAAGAPRVNYKYLTFAHASVKEGELP